MKARSLALGMMFIATAVAGAKEPLSIRVTPAVSYAPANIVIQASVEPDTDNRAIEVVADSPEFYRSSAIALEGDRAPRTSRFEFRSLPPGEYAITASVIGADGQRRAIAHRNVNVIESGSVR